MKGALSLFQNVTKIVGGDGYFNSCSSTLTVLIFVGSRNLADTKV